MKYHTQMVERGGSRTVLWANQGCEHCLFMYGYTLISPHPCLLNAPLLSVFALCLNHLPTHS